MVDNVLKVEKIIDIVDEGVTFPIRCFLSNGKEAYVKYIKNPAGTMTLINEFIGYNIAKELNFTIPNFGLCSLDKSAIENFDNLEAISFNNIGLSFYTESITSAVKINLYISKTNINNELEKCLLIDYLLNNKDRHIGNVLYSFNKQRVYFIDFSHIISRDNKALLDINLANDKSKEYILSDSIIVNNTKNNINVYDILNNLMGFSEERIEKEAKRIKSKISNKFLNEIMKNIPSQWISKNLNTVINDYFLIIKERLKYIDDIVKIYIKNRKGKV